MATTFKLIKKKEFTTNGVTGIAYTVALKGRALNLSTLSFEDETDAIKEEGDKVIVNCAIEVVKRPYIDALGNSVMGLSIMPALGVTISDI